MSNKVTLDSFLKEISEKTTVNNQYPVLTSSRSGLYLQSDYFNKQVASKDNTGYKIIRKGQFTYRAMSDTGEFFPNMLECTDIGIVSPAYPVFEITKPGVVLPEYLKYFFKSDVFQYSIASFVQGSTRTSVKFGKLKTVSINLPTIDEQKTIVDLLDRASKLIQLRREEMQEYDAFIKARFIEMFGDPVDNPMKWPEMTLKDACDKLTDGTHFSPESFSEGPYKYITAKNIKVDGYDFSNLTYVTEDVHRSVYERCNPEFGDILYIKDGATTGIAMINTLHEEFTMLSSVALLKYKRSLLRGQFLKALMNYPTFYNHMRGNMGGAAITRLTVKKLLDTIIYIPPLDQQTLFETFAEQSDKSKVIVKKTVSFDRKITIQ